MFFASAHPNNVLLVVAGLVGGLLVGITGTGGGALMTPILVLLFKIDPKVAIASDLVSSLLNKPVGGLVHARRGTVDRGLVIRLVVGSVPAAFLGAFTLNAFSNSNAVQADVKTILGWALIVACVSLVAKTVLGALRDRRSGSPSPDDAPHELKTVPTVLIGVAGGFLVGMTSVGSGSLMMVLLMLMYPRLSSTRLVGTDLVQAVPLVGSAAVGQLVFGHVDFGLAGALVVGSIPGVYVGALVSARAPDGIVRPLLVFILVASALALLFANDNTGLAWALGIILITGIPLWGAVDGALRSSSVWETAGLDRTNWLAALGVGAPFGIGLLVAVPYFVRVRPRLRAAASADAQASAVQTL